MIIENESYLIEVKADGIYLYKKYTDEIEQLSTKTAQMQLSTQISAIDSKQDKPIQSQTSKSIKLLEKITLLGSSYELTFAVVDAIVNRSLQRNFSFENDVYANHLRIIFSLLVPELNIKEGFNYDEKYLKTKTNQLDIDGFMAIKRLLDADEGGNSGKTKASKEKFLNISRLKELDIALSTTLEKYYSDNSESEGEHSDEEDPLLNYQRFSYSLSNYSPEQSELIETSRIKFNQFLKDRNPKEDRLELVNGRIKIGDEALAVEFVIPGFRGINHMPLRFSDEARRLYRSQAFQLQRAKTPYYSEAVLMSHFDFYRDADGISQHLLAEEENNQNRDELDENAKKLEELLLRKRDEDYILVTGLSNGSKDDIRLFSNLLYFLQHVYSNGIIKSQRLLREHLLQGEIFFPMPNAYNPFVSESETPEHALRYSFGQKSLYKPASLHPHYNQNGRPSFPYVGEVYISIRGMDVFTSKRERHQLRRLEKIYRVNPSSYIGPEIESTGFAWLPSGEVVYSEVIKCPNFAGHWKKTYFDKYGLKKSQFNIFKQRFIESQNKSARFQIETDVIDHLIQHYKDRLLQRAVNQAKDRILIFLNSDGTLDFKLPTRDIRTEAVGDAKSIRVNIERKLKDHINMKEPDLEVQLTSKKMKIYYVNPDLVQRVINDMKQQKLQESSKYDQFSLDDEQLRTPPSMCSSPRTPTSSPRKWPESPYRYTGSPGTPLSSSKYKSILSNSPDKQEEKKEITTYASLSQKFKKNMENVQRTASAPPVTQQLLQSALIESLGNHDVRVVFHDIQPAKFFQEELFKIGIENRGMKNGPREIEKLMADMEHSQDRYAINLTNDEWNALNPDTVILQQQPMMQFIGHSQNINQSNLQEEKKLDDEEKQYIDSPKLFSHHSMGQ